MAIIAALITFATRFGWSALHQKVLELNPAAILVVLAVLPMIGFSIVAVDIILGAKFGVMLGMGAVIGITAFHLLASHWIARSILREPLQRFLLRHQRKLPVLPPNQEVAVSVLFALVPGLPYFARNYLLALSDIPLRIYFWCCLPIYVARAYLTLSLGDWSGSMTREKIYYLSAVYIIKLGVSAVLLWHVRGRLKLPATHVAG